MDEIYLDHASTAPLDPAALAAMTEASTDLFADPARLYGRARRARMALDDARARIASVIGGRPEEIIFTSGGTESCNLAITAGAKAGRAARKPLRVLISAVEHSAVLEPARALAADGFEVVEIPVDGTGRVDPASIDEPTGLVSIQHANHELGSVQPLAEAAAAAHAAGAIVHTDACMTLGTLPVDVKALGVDLLSGSAHKFGGPRGAGFLWVRKAVRVRPMLLGDDRERGRRAGIENLPAIVGMAAALDARVETIEAEATRLRALTDHLRAELASMQDLVVHGHPTERLPGLVAFSVLYADGETLLLALDAKGIAVHSGSSCTSSANEPSHVLAAAGALTQGSVRVSLGSGSTATDVDALLRELPPIVARLRKAAGLDPARP